MRDDVPKPGRASPVDLRHPRLDVIRELLRRLSDDFQIAHGCVKNQDIAAKRLFRDPGRELLYQAASVQDVFEQ
jgi:hypothetical protein